MIGQNKKWSKKRTIAIIVAGTILVLASAELQLRIYHYFRPSFIYYDQSYNRFRAKPLSMDYGFQLNSLGFKDAEYQLSKPDGTFRVLAVGASFAFGVVPYFQNYLTVLEQHLNEEGVAVEVINMGIPGIGPNRYGSVLVNEGLQFNPDMVIINFFIGNAFLASKRHRQLHTYSYLASLVRFLTKTREEYKGLIIHQNEIYVDEKPTLSDLEFLRIQASRLFQFESDNEKFDRLAGDAMHYIGNVKRVCDKNDIKLLVLIIPDSMQIDPEVRAQVIEYSGTTAAYYDFDRPNRILEGHLKASGIDYLDLTQVMIEQGRNKALYKPNDTHWNIAGNQLAARELQRYFDKLRAPSPGGFVRQSAESLQSAD